MSSESDSQNRSYSPPINLSDSEDVPSSSSSSVHQEVTILDAQRRPFQSVGTVHQGNPRMVILDHNDETSSDRKSGSEQLDEESDEEGGEGKEQEE